MTVPVPTPRNEPEPTSASEPGRGPSVASVVPDEPPPELRFRRALKLGTSLRALWDARHTVSSLAVRDLRSTYNQEILGVGWALLQPFTLMVVFTFLFNRVGKVNTGGVAYPLFSYIGLVPWTFYANSVQTAGLSLVNQPLLNKVYAPREVFPLSEVVVAAVGALCASLALGVLFLFEWTAPASTSYWVLPLIVILVGFTVACSLLAGAVTVYLRDVRHALPLLMQLGLFLTPVVYGLRELPVAYRAPYCAINPLGAVIDGFRECVLYGRAPSFAYTTIAAASTVVYLLGTYLIFKRLETGFADVS